MRNLRSGDLLILITLWLGVVVFFSEPFTPEMPQEQPRECVNHNACFSRDIRIPI